MTTLMVLALVDSANRTLEKLPLLSAGGRVEWHAVSGSGQVPTGGSATSARNRLFSRSMRRPLVSRSLPIRTAGTFQCTITRNLGVDHACGKRTGRQKRAKRFRVKLTLKRLRQAMARFDLPFRRHGRVACGPRRSGAARALCLPRETTGRCLTRATVEDSTAGLGQTLRTRARLTARLVWVRAFYWHSVAWPFWDRVFSGRFFCPTHRLRE